MAVVEEVRAVVAGETSSSEESALTAAPAGAAAAPVLVRRSLADQVRDIAWMASDLAKGTRWPGGALGALGVILIGVVVAVEEVSDRLASAEFVAALIVGAALALAGPLVVVYGTTTARRDAVDMDLANKEALAAEAAAREEAERRARTTAELELAKLRHS